MYEQEEIFTLDSSKMRWKKFLLRTVLRLQPNAARQSVCMSFSQGIQVF